jgi:hypothetical protein
VLLHKFQRSPCSVPPLYYLSSHKWD